MVNMYFCKKKSNLILKFSIFLKGDSKIDVMGGLQNAVLALQNDTRIPILGFVQSLCKKQNRKTQFKINLMLSLLLLLVEASMYTFVFMWTPVLEDVNLVFF